MDWPAEVVGIRDEIGTGIMVLPVFAEAIGFAAFSTVAMPVGAVEAFQKRGVDGMADGRERQRGLQSASASSVLPSDVGPLVSTCAPVVDSVCQALLPTPDDAGDQRPHDPSFLLDVD